MSDDAVHPIIGILHATSTNQKAFYPLGWLASGRISYRVEVARQASGQDEARRYLASSVWRAGSTSRRPITEADGWGHTWPSWVRTGLT